jgi:hypothetical protein
MIKTEVKSFFQGPDLDTTNDYDKGRGRIGAENRHGSL